MADARPTPSRFPSDRRERALAMVEAGLIGGAGRGQGRKPRGQTASEQVAELAEREAGAIKRAFSEGLRSRNERTRLLSAEGLLAAERRERDRQDYEKTLRALPSAELDAMLINIIGESLGLDLSALHERLHGEDVTDADVVEEGAALPPVTDGA